MHNRLSTGDIMLRWNIGVGSSCIFCGDMESRNHLFFGCKYSEEVWVALARKLFGAQFTTQWDAIVELLIDAEQNMISLFLKRYVFQVTIFWIWRERNGQRHGEQPTPSSCLKQRID
ncbi:unnamed protein product [Microthlaspi erraticum]|uniref:Reverse transcriptase zinc-binding domain-containing protein n=1 Tax=Microthlaspi erraticum TaxID=1685480 RepID=A0A6D2KFF8_9BRAS|nr:unnamed protein product [Microthlaspi erraticum]